MGTTKVSCVKFSVQLFEEGLVLKQRIVYLYEDSVRITHVLWLHYLTKLLVYHCLLCVPDFPALENFLPIEGCRCDAADFCSYFFEPISE